MWLIMSFLKSIKEFEDEERETLDFYDVESLSVYWETKKEVIEKLLPSPLLPAKRQLVVAYIARIPKTNFGVSYIESGLSIRCQFQGEEGSYIVSMPVNNDMAMAAGREFIGFPKKMGNLHIKRNEKEIEGWVERQGTRLIEIHAKLTGKFNEKDALKIIMELGGGMNPTLVVFNFKHFPAPDSLGFDYNPRLIREEIENKFNSIEFGEVEITLNSSKNDPWAEIEIERVLGATFTVGDTFLHKGSVLAEVNPTEFAKYSFLKWDKDIPFKI